MLNIFIEHQTQLLQNNIFLTAMKMRKTSILMINDKYSLKTHDESRKE